LADYFVYSVTNKKPIWVKTQKSLKSNLKQLEIFLDKKITQKLYADLFIKGSKKSGIELWTGYATGFQIVLHYAKQHSTMSQVSIAKKPASIFRKSIRELPR